MSQLCLSPACNVEVMGEQDIVSKIEEADLLKPKSCFLITPRKYIIERKESIFTPLLL